MQAAQRAEGLENGGLAAKGPAAAAGKGLAAGAGSRRCAARAISTGDSRPPPKRPARGPLTPLPRPPPQGPGRHRQRGGRLQPEGYCWQGGRGQGRAGAAPRALDTPENHIGAVGWRGQRRTAPRRPTVRCRQPGPAAGRHAARALGALLHPLACLTSAPPRTPPQLSCRAGPVC